MAMFQQLLRLVSEATLVVSYFMSDQFAKTVEVSQPLTKLPDDPGQLYALGVSLVRTGDSASAARVFRQMWNRTRTSRRYTFSSARLMPIMIFITPWHRWNGFHGRSARTPPCPCWRQATWV